MFIALVSMMTVFETVLVIVTGRMIDIATAVSGIVEGGIAIGGSVDPGNVVVYVSVTSPPSTLAGIADPTPEAVNCVGIGRVAVLGFEELFWE